MLDGAGGQVSKVPGWVGVWRVDPRVEPEDDDLGCCAKSVIGILSTVILVLSSVILGLDPRIQPPYIRKETSLYWACTQMDLSCSTTFIMP